MSHSSLYPSKYQAPAQSDMASTEDQQYFQEAMRGVKPLHRSSIHSAFIQKPKRSLTCTSTTYSDIPQSKLPYPETYSDFLSPEYTSSDTSYPLGTFNGISRKILHNLSKGKYRIEKTLDLHGCTLNIAHQQVTDLIKQAVDTQIRCVLIIHGRGLSSPDGKPVLRDRLSIWLQEIPQVLAYTYACAQLGGNGATFVLLKRR